PLGHCPPLRPWRRVDRPPSVPRVVGGGRRPIVPRDEPAADPRQPDARTATPRPDRLLRTLARPGGGDRRGRDGHGAGGLDCPPVPRTRRGAHPRNAAEGTVVPAH